MLSKCPTIASIARSRQRFICKIAASLAATSVSILHAAPLTEGYRNLPIREYNLDGDNNSGTNLNPLTGTHFVPGDYLSFPGHAQNDPNGNGSWGAGRTTNIIYHSGWLMTGSEGPGSPSEADMFFRVYDIENPGRAVRMFPVRVYDETFPNPENPSYPAASFDIVDDGWINWAGRSEYSTQQEDRDDEDGDGNTTERIDLYPAGSWAKGNWGFHTHGHFQAKHGVMGDGLYTEEFGGVVTIGHPDNTVSVEGSPYPVSYGMGHGRTARQHPWGFSDDWSYGDDQTYAYFSKQVFVNPANRSYNNISLEIAPLALLSAEAHAGVVGFPVVFGDKVIVMSDQRDSGVAVYQIPDASYDILLDSTKVEELWRALQENNSLPRVQDGQTFDPAIHRKEWREINLNDYLNPSIVQLPELNANDRLGVSTQSYGGYWPEFYANSGKLYAVFTDTDKVQVVLLDDGEGFLAVPELVRDFSNFDQYSVPFYGETADGIIANGETRTGGITNAGYPKFQDNRLYIGDFVFNMDEMIAGNEDPAEVILRADHEQRTSQYSMPLGNLVVTGGYGTHGGMGIWIQDLEPDTARPEVAYHIPKNFASNYPRTAPISFIIHETMDNTRFDASSHFTVHETEFQGGVNVPVGDPIEGLLLTGSGNVYTFTPHEALKADTIYEVRFHADDRGTADTADDLGFADASGNLIEPYSYQFSTGDFPGVDQKPDLSQASLSADVTRAGLGSTLNFDFSGATDPEDGSTLEFRVNDGSGSGFGEWQTHDFANTLELQASFNEEGRFLFTVEVRDSSGNRRSLSQSVLIFTPPSDATRPNNSSSIISTGVAIWNVNPDANTITEINPYTNTVVNTYPVGRDPRSIAEGPDGRLWVTCFDSDQIYVFDPSGDMNSPTIIEDPAVVGYGAAPFAVTATPDGSRMLVSYYGLGQLVAFDPSTLEVLDAVSLAPTVRAIAVDATSSWAYVTQFISQDLEGTVFRVRLSDFNSWSITLDKSNENDAGDQSAGMPNYLAGIAISPDNNYILVTAKKDNLERGLTYGTLDLTHESTVRAIMRVIDRSDHREILDAERDFDNSDSPTGVAFTPDGDVALIALQGNGQLIGIDGMAIEAPTTLTQVRFRTAVGSPNGSAPQGIAVHPGSDRIFVQNLTDGTVSSVPADTLFNGAAFTTGTPTTIQTVDSSLTTTEIARGKQVFYHAADVRMSAESYISCASCHVDGGTDATIRDFAGRGEGIRRTPSLRGRGGMAHGNVHWSGNFDEMQDFEFDIRGPFGGEGFIDTVEHPGVVDSSDTTSGRSTELDALAAYVASLDETTLPRSPYREADGSLTVEAIAGRNHMITMNCMSCHSGSNYTESVVQEVGSFPLRTVGSTIENFTGTRLGDGTPLETIDVPTLLGLYENTRFLHHGEAASLDEAMAFAGGIRLDAAEAERVWQATPNSIDVISRDPANGGGGSGWLTPMGSFQGKLVEIRSDTEDANGDGSLDNSEDYDNDGVIDSSTAPNGVRFTGISNGSAGSAELWVRMTHSSGDDPVIVRVNGQTIPTAPLGRMHEARFAYLEWTKYTVNLNASNNTVEILRSASSDQSLFVDAIQIITTEAKANAHPHSRILTELNTAEQTELFSYLLSLDGRDANGNFPDPNAVSAIDFESQALSTDPEAEPLLIGDFQFTSSNGRALHFNGTSGGPWPDSWPSTVLRVGTWGQRLILQRIDRDPFDLTSFESGSHQGASLQITAFFPDGSESTQSHNVLAQTRSPLTSIEANIEGAERIEIRWFELADAQGGNRGGVIDNLVIGSQAASPAASAYEIYAEAHNLTGTASEDDDGDGLSNLGEFAFGGHLLAAQQIAQPFTHQMETGGTILLEFNRRKDSTLEYRIEHSSTLAPDSWAPANATEVDTPESIDNDYESVRFRVTPNNATRFFVRIRVIDG